MLTELEQEPVVCNEAGLSVEERMLGRAKRMAALCHERRAENVRLFDLRGLCGYTDFLVVASVASRPQMRAVTRDIEKEFLERKYRPLHPSPASDERWTLVDYGDIVVHLFSPDAREFYDIEAMWADAPEPKLDFSQKPVQDEL